MINCDNIKNEYENKNYSNVLLEINNYLNNNNSLTDEIFHIYIKCQIRLGMYNEALQNLDKMIKLYPSFFTNFDLAKKYALCNDIKNLDNILKNNTFSADEYCILAITCFYNNQYDKAKSLFDMALNKNPKLTEKINYYLKKIEIYKDKNVFRESYYSYLKSIGKNIELGNIISPIKIDDNYNYLKDKCAYLVWKIEDNYIYAVPITNIAYKDIYTLYKEDYTKYDNNRYIKEDLIRTKEEHSYKVLDKVKSKDFNKILKKIENSNIIKSKYNQYKTNDIKVNKYNIIKIQDYNYKKNKYFFILEINDKKYIAIEVEKQDNLYNIKDDKLVYLNNNINIIEKINLKEEQINNLLNKVPDNYKGNDIVGCIINYNDQVLEIMIEKNNYYLCLDRTYNYHNSFISIQYLRKDIPIYITKRLEDEEFKARLSDFLLYIKENYRDMSNQKKIKLK